METVVEIMSRGVAPKQLTRKEGLMYDPVGSLTTPDAKVHHYTLEPSYTDASSFWSSYGIHICKPVEDKRNHVAA
jgi:hypothetical protein